MSFNFYIGQFQEISGFYSLRIKIRNKKSFEKYLITD